jgi:hypothetical protein
MSLILRDRIDLVYACGELGLVREHAGAGRAFEQGAGGGQEVSTCLYGKGVAWRADYLPGKKLRPEIYRSDCDFVARELTLQLPTHRHQSL